MKRVLVFAISALVLFVAGWSWLAFYPATPVDLGGVASMDGEARHLRVPVADGDSLDAWYVAGPEPAVVILFHGFGRNHERMWRYGQFLRKAGYHVVLPEFRSARERKRLPTTLGVHEAADAEAIYGWVRSQPELRGHVVGVFGESLGGSVALLLAAEHPDIDAIIDDSGFATGDRAISDGFKSFFLPPWPCTPLARWLGTRVTGYDAGKTDAIAAATTLRDRPILFIRGGADRRVSLGQTRALWEAAGSDDSLWVIPGAGHCEGWKRNRAEYEQRVTTFLDEHLLLAWARRNAGRGIR